MMSKCSSLLFVAVLALITSAVVGVVDSSNNNNNNTSLRSRRWIALSSGIPDQKHQRRTGFGPRVSHFAGVDDGVQHHLETKVAAVFNKVAFRNPSTTTTTTTKTTSSRSVIDTNYSLPSHIIVDITPTAAPSSSVSEMFAFSRQNITGLVTTTPRRLNGSVPTGDPAKKRNRNKPKKQKPFVIAVGVATESPTLEKLGDNSRQILFGSSTPRSSSFSSTTIAAAAKKTTTPPTTTTTTTTSTTTTTETPTTATAKKSVMQLTPDQITPNDSSFLPDDLLLVKNSTTEFPKELFSRLDSAWDAHVYTFMALFLLLAFLCVVFAARLASKQPTALSKGYNVSMLIFVTTLAVTQSVSLFAEFYGAQVFKPELIPAMATLSLPCLTSSFAVLFLALLDATRLQIMSPYVQNPVSMAGVIVLHFLLSVSSVMTLGDSMMGKFVFLLGQIVFVTWALGLAFGYLYGSRAMVRMARTLRLQEAIAGGDGKYAPNLLGPIRVGFLVGALVSLTAIVVVYTMVLSVLDKQQHHHHQHQQHDGSTTTRNSPWPWWPTHIVLRSVEVVFGFLVLFVARMPRRFDSGGHHHHHHQQHLSGTASKSHHQHPSSSCRNTLSTCLSSWRRAHRYRNGVSDVTAVWQTHNRGVVGSGRDDDDDDDETEDLYPTYCNSNQAVKNFERTNGRPVYSDALTVGNLHVRSVTQQQCFAIAMVPKRRQTRRRGYPNTLAGHPHHQHQHHHQQQQQQQHNHHHHQPHLANNHNTNNNNNTSSNNNMMMMQNNDLRTEIIDRSTCSCTRPVSMMSSEYRLPRDTYETAASLTNFQQQPNRTKFYPHHEANTVVAVAASASVGDDDISNDAGSRVDMAASDNLSSRRQQQQQQRQNSYPYHQKQQQHYLQSSPAYQLPADCRSGRLSVPRSTNAVRRQFSNASVQTQPVSSVSMQTSQTSPIVVTADNLSSRNSSVFDIDKHVSACSSESAAASSFDVHMFLDETMSHEEEEEEEDDVFPECDIPEPVLDSEMFLQHQATSLSSPSYNSLPSLEVASLMALQDRLGGGYAAENCNKNNVRKNNNARLAAPPTSFRTVLHQHREPNSTDITPDSAVVADMSQLSSLAVPYGDEDDDDVDDGHVNGDDDDDEEDDLDDGQHSKRSVASSISDFWKLSTRSINDLFKSSPVVRQSRRKAKDILDRLQLGSNFSLNNSSMSRVRRYSPLDCDDEDRNHHHHHHHHHQQQQHQQQPVSSLKRFCSEYEVHLAEMDSMLSAEMSRLSPIDDDHHHFIGGASAEMNDDVDDDQRRHLSAAAAAAVGGDGAYHPSAYAANNSSRQQFVAAARHSRGTWCDDSFDVPVVSNGFHQDLVLSPRQRQQHQLLSSACNYDSSADSGKSLELLDSVNRDCEDYGESDVDVNPNILKARILKVCDNIRQFSDQPALNQSSSVESAF